MMDEYNRLVNDSMQEFCKRYQMVLELLGVSASTTRKYDEVKDVFTRCQELHGEDSPAWLEIGEELTMLFFCRAHASRCFAKHGMYGEGFKNFLLQDSPI